jgi:hypothetical protein
MMISYYRELAGHNSELARRCGEIGDLMTLRSDVLMATHYYGLENTYREAAIWNREMALKREAKMRGRRMMLVAVVALLALLLLTGVSMAQVEEPLVTNTPAAVVTPVTSGAGVAVVTLPDQQTVYAAFVVLAMLILGAINAVQQRSVGRLIDTINRALENKTVREAAEQRYMESSLPVKQFVELLASVSAMAGSLNLPVVDPLADKTTEFLQEVIGKAGTSPPVAPASGGK